MTRYDEVPGHALAGVPQDVLDVARAVLLSAAFINDVDDEQSEPIADAVVAALREAGFIRLSVAPSRDQVIFNLRYEHKVWEEFEAGGNTRRSLYTHLADEVVEPLLDRGN